MYVLVIHILLWYRSAHTVCDKRALQEYKKESLAKRDFQLFKTHTLHIPVFYCKLQRQWCSSCAGNETSDLYGS